MCQLADRIDWNRNDAHDLEVRVERERKQNIEPSPNGWKRVRPGKNAPFGSL